MEQLPQEEEGRPARTRLTPLDIQQKVFRRSMFRGYHEQEVDDFLDEVTEELALLLDEIRQLRERPGGQSGGGADLTDARRTADDIVLRAREEAAEILRKARTGAVASSGPGRSSMQPFLSEERTFLQDLSRLIQAHADTVRDMAKARSAAATGPAPAPAPQAPSESEPESEPIQDMIEVGEAEASQAVEDRT